MEYQTAAKKFGTVMNDSTEVAMTQAAYMENYGSGVRYYAAGVDQQGNDYLIAWDTTNAWDEASESYQAAIRNGSDPEIGMLDDESNACDWSSPVEIKSV